MLYVLKRAKHANLSTISIFVNLLTSQRILLAVGNIIRRGARRRKLPLDNRLHATLGQHKLPQHVACLGR